MYRPSILPLTTPPDYMFKSSNILIFYIILFEIFPSILLKTILKLDVYMFTSFNVSGE